MSQDASKHSIQNYVDKTLIHYKLVAKLFTTFNYRA